MPYAEPDAVYTYYQYRMKYRMQYIQRPMQYPMKYTKKHGRNTLSISWRKTVSDVAMPCASSGPSGVCVWQFSLV